MDTIIDGTEEDVERLVLEGNAMVLGGVEVHVEFVRHNGDAGIQVSWTPPFGAESRDNETPDWMKEINQRLAGLCRETVMMMQDRPRLKLLKLVRKDSGKDRMLYRLLVTVRIADDGTRERRVYDFIDPAFLAIDPGVAIRAKRMKDMVEAVREKE